MSFLAVFAGLLVTGYLILRWNRLWVYRLWDRALRNDRRNLPGRYERPRYYTLNRRQVDTAARWPGWDGWYFFMLPDDRRLPLRMVRASLMTGLYGLDGVDDYEKLPLELSTFGAVEYLSLTPTDERVDGRIEKENYVSHHYLPKSTALRMDAKRLDVSVSGSRVIPDEQTEQYGRISGRWPEYRLEFTNPEADVKLELDYRGQDLLWWADTRFFSYFAAFGRFQGKVRYKRGTSRESPYDLTGQPEVFAVQGQGFFEHGFARKPFNFDRLWLPVQGLKRIAPPFKPVRYHYELFVGDDGHHGGFMKARGFGIDFRNRGGVYQGDEYLPIHQVKVRYAQNRGMNGSTQRTVNRCQVDEPVDFPRIWNVRARTDRGVLEYTAERDFPPAQVARNLTYYTFAYEGSHGGRALRGRGYGEYLHI